MSFPLKINLYKLRDLARDRGYTEHVQYYPLLEHFREFYSNQLF